MAILTREECLKLDIQVYNKAMDLEWSTHKTKMNLSGELSICEHCSRKYVVCCICDKAEARFANLILEVRAVSEGRNEEERILLSKYAKELLDEMEVGESYDYKICHIKLLEELYNAGRVEPKSDGFRHYVKRIT